MTTCTGMLLGIAISIFAIKGSFYFQGSIMGFVSGITLALITLRLLPEAFKFGSLYYTIIGFTLGSLTCYLVNKKFYNISPTLKKRKKPWAFKTGLLISLGIVLHDIIVGITLGPLFNININDAINLIIVMVIEATLDGLAISIPFKQSGAKTSKIIKLSIVVSIPMGIGALIGSMLKTLSPKIICLSLSFAVGFVLYTTLFQVFPTTKKMCGNKLLVISSILGMVLGLYIGF